MKLLPKEHQPEMLKRFFKISTLGDDFFLIFPGLNYYIR